MSREPTADALGLHERASATPSGGPRSESLAELGHAPAWTEGELSLRDQQAWFSAIICTPENEPAPVDERSAARLIAASPTQTPLERLAIYRRAYHARLIECLIDDYPVLKHALGDEAFETLCRAYIARHPSTAPSLNYFGRHFSDFCRTEPLAAPGFAADLATLEWAIVLAIHARGATTISLEDLSRVPGDRFPGARFALNPTLTVLELEYPVNGYLQSYREGRAPTALPGPRPTRVAVYRTGRSVWRLELEPALLALITAFSAGMTLQAALEQIQTLVLGLDSQTQGHLETAAAAEAAEAEAAATATVSRCFREAVSSGLFSKLLL